MNKTLKNTISDLVTDFLVYDRKEDQELPVGMIEKMNVDQDTSVDEIVDTFKFYLSEALDS